MNIHLVEVEEGLCQLENVVAKIDLKRRQDIRRNHSVTHLLHQALKDTLGDHVNQAGSEVGPDRMRFDFTHFEPVNAEILNKIERNCKQQNI